MHVHASVTVIRSRVLTQLQNSLVLLVLPICVLQQVRKSYAVRRCVMAASGLQQVKIIQTCFG